MYRWHVKWFHFFWLSYCLNLLTNLSKLPQKRAKLLKQEMLLLNLTEIAIVFHKDM